MATDEESDDTEAEKRELGRLGNGGGARHLDAERGGAFEVIHLEIGRGSNRGGSG
jgi:hypothetical protein